jgi:hypothetical protein
VTSDREYLYEHELPNDDAQRERLALPEGPIRPPRRLSVLLPVRVATGRQDWHDAVLVIEVAPRPDGGDTRAQVQHAAERVSRLLTRLLAEEDKA